MARGSGLASPGEAIQHPFPGIDRWRKELKITVAVMAWRIDKHVVRGLIQNIVPGRVVGTIWLEGLDTPLELNLKGNAYRDLAGARLSFVNPEPIKGDYDGLDIHQDGVVGDITASKKVKELADPNAYFAAKKAGEAEEDTPPSYVWSNCLYLEWFSESNGRVLVETTQYKWKVSLPKWRLSEGEESEQKERNMEAMFNFMDEVSRALAPNDIDVPEEGEMDEFQWEKYLQKTDARSDMLLELFEKYEDEPNCEELVAEAMGWDVESVEIVEEEDDDFEEVDDEAFDDADDFLPNHPLISDMMDIISRIFFETESRGLLNEETSNPWNQLLWNSQLAVSKLIASLENLSDGLAPEPGFVVATLKRALHLIHLSIATLEAAVSAQRKKANWQKDIRRDLFEVRESILNLMQEYRGKL